MARTAAPADETTEVSDAFAVTLPKLDAAVPPRFVRRKRDGMVTRWSTLFKRNIDEFEPFYRPKSDDALAHAAAIRTFEYVAAMKAGGFGMLGNPTFGGLTNDVGLDRGRF